MRAVRGRGGVHLRAGGDGRGRGSGQGGAARDGGHGPPRLGGVRPHEVCDMCALWTPAGCFHLWMDEG